MKKYYRIGLIWICIAVGLWALLVGVAGVFGRIPDIMGSAIVVSAGTGLFYLIRGLFSKSSEK